MNCIILDKKDIIKCTIPSIEDVKGLPTEILKASDWWWLKSPGEYRNRVAYVDNYGYINRYGHDVSNDITAVRPLLITNLKYSKLKVGNIYKIFGTDWYYIGDGKFLKIDIIGRHRFNDNPYRGNWLGSKISKKVYFYLCEKAELNNYEKSELKEYLEEWFSRLEDK